MSITWIILCGSSGDVTRLDGSEIGCQPYIIVFHWFSSLLLLFIHHYFGVLYDLYDRKLFNPNF
jgi:ABC-type multidrug transport system permease subunit